MLEVLWSAASYLLAGIVLAVLVFVLWFVIVLIISLAEAHRRMKRGDDK